MKKYFLDKIALAIFLALVMSLTPMGFKWDNAVQFEQNTVEARGPGGAGGGPGGAGGGPGGAGGGPGGAGGGPGGAGGGPGGAGGGPGGNDQNGDDPQGNQGEVTSAAAKDDSTTGLDKAMSVVGTTPASESAMDALQAAADRQSEMNDGDDPNGDDPNGDDPNGDDPNGEEPNGEEPNGEEPNGEEPNGEDSV